MSGAGTAAVDGVKLYTSVTVPFQLLLKVPLNVELSGKFPVPLSEGLVRGLRVLKKAMPSSRRCRSRYRPR